MAYGILHTKSYTAQAAKGIGCEEDRWHLKEQNPDIDVERSHLNFTKIRKPHETLYQAAKKRLEEHGLEVPKKKNRILFEQTVITASPQFFIENGITQEALSKMRSADEIVGPVKEWMEASEQWALDYFGADNVISLTWHLDETSPHMHVDHVPIVNGTFKNKVYVKDTEGRVLHTETGSPLCARDAEGKMIYEVKQGCKLSRDAYWQERGGRNSFRLMQQSYYEKVSKRFGLLRGEQSELTERKHIEQQRYKAEMAAQEAEQNQFEAEVAKGERDLAIKQAADAREMAQPVEKNEQAGLGDPELYDLWVGAKRTVSGDYKITKEQATAISMKIQAAVEAQNKQSEMQKALLALSDRLISEQNRQIDYVRDKSYEERAQAKDYEKLLIDAACWRRFKQTIQELPETLRSAIGKIAHSIEKQCMALIHRPRQEM